MTEYPLPDDTQAGGYFPAEQQALHDRCVHPNGGWEELTYADIEQAIGDRFEKIAVRFAERLAIKSDRSSLTYAELNSLANQIARAILAADGASRQPVALLLPNEPHCYAAVLGVLKTARPFVALDPSFPAERLAFLWADSNATLLVLAGEYRALASHITDPTPPCIDLGALDKNLAADNLDLAISPDQMAMIAYTSGSTGQPKGVCHSHRTILHTLMRMTNTFHLSSEDRRGILKSFGSSASFTDIIYAILNGGTAILYDVTRSGFNDIGQWLAAERITTTVFITTIFRQFVETLSTSPALPHLRLITVGGETIAPSDISAFQRYPQLNCLLSLGFGVTEMISCAMCFVDKAVGLGEREIPSGFPLNDIEILILDEQRSPLDRGQVGEVALRSPYLALGYWNQPELTAARFLPDPDGGDRRIYLTGDVGKLRADGCFVHLGRADAQVKIRGYRVETPEIENCLLQLPAVRSAAVVAHPDPSGELRLVAYVVCGPDAALSAAALRQHLSATLPVYMIPAIFVFLDTLPQTPNGKIDRRALPPPDSRRPQLGVAWQPATTPVEAKLTALWCDILGLDEIGIHDPFLELGGNSLQAMRIAARVNEEFGVEIPLTELFATSTVAEMALAVVIALASEADITQVGER